MLVSKNCLRDNESQLNNTSPGTHLLFATYTILIQTLMVPRSLSISSFVGSDPCYTFPQSYIPNTEMWSQLSPAQNPSELSPALKTKSKPHGMVSKTY